MVYAIVTKSNVVYQPRENIKTLLQTNLTDSTTQIYSFFPNQKSIDFRGFPFIIIPDFEIPLLEDFFSSNIKEFGMNVECQIYHDSEKLGDNKLRIIKQNIIQTFNKRSNLVILDGYGVRNVNVEFDSSSPILILFDQKKLSEVSFTISCSVEVDFS